MGLVLEQLTKDIMAVHTVEILTGQVVVVVVLVVLLQEVIMRLVGLDEHLV
jgi:hypothetical protein